MLSIVKWWLLQGKANCCWLYFQVTSCFWVTMGYWLWMNYTRLQKFMMLEVLPCQYLIQRVSRRRAFLLERIAVTVAGIWLLPILWLMSHLLQDNRHRQTDTKPIFWLLLFLLIPKSTLKSSSALYKLKKFIQVKHQPPALASDQWKSHLFMRTR